MRGPWRRLACKCEGSPMSAIGCSSAVSMASPGLVPGCLSVFFLFSSPLFSLFSVPLPAPLARASARPTSLICTDWAVQAKMPLSRPVPSPVPKRCRETATVYRGCHGSCCSEALPMRE
ncbi:hypothetical protein V8C26DRAFT_384645 [Trichoderma gracile]